VRKRFPAACVFRQNEQVGIAGIRKRGLEDARGEYVFSIDDDAYFTDRSTLGEAVEAFEKHPSAAIVALRYVEANRDIGRDLDSLRGEEDAVVELGSFTSCAYGIRREVGIGVGNYREYLRYRGEEKDLAIRVLDSGFSVIYLSTPPIVHLYSPSRDWHDMMWLEIRNNYLFTFLNLPALFVLPRLLINCVNSWRHYFSLAKLPRLLLFSLCGLCNCLKYTAERRPVSIKTYRRYRSLPAHPAQRSEGFGDLSPVRTKPS